MNCVLEVLLRAQVELVCDPEFERTDREFDPDAHEPCGDPVLDRGSIELVVHELD
jgi:hypothetical protein